VRAYVDTGRGGVSALPEALPWDECVEIRVYGIPGPQGSKRFVGMKGGKGVMIESSAKVKGWRNSVVYAAIDALGGGGCICGPLSVEMIFTLPKPKSAPKNRKTFPDKKPDCSKLVRSTEDALVDAGVIEDDARIVELHARKVFPKEHPDALHVPGAVIRIRSIA
jgi:Holliday junction resolvase RusA-like endonuclease